MASVFASLQPRGQVVCLFYRSLHDLLHLSNPHPWLPGTISIHSLLTLSIAPLRDQTTQSLLPSSSPLCLQLHPRHRSNLWVNPTTPVTVIFPRRLPENCLHNLNQCHCCSLNNRLRLLLASLCSSSFRPSTPSRLVRFPLRRNLFLLHLPALPVGTRSHGLQRP
jgi:hypothetical protein